MIGTARNRLQRSPFESEGQRFDSSRAHHCLAVAGWSAARCSS